METETQLAPEITLEDQRTELLSKRTAGRFAVNIRREDLKHLKNLIQNKIEWKGPNEAYLLIITTLTLAECLDSMDPKSSEAETIHLPATVIESINLLLNKVTGKGIDSAQKIFSFAMMLRPASEEIKKLDQELTLLSNKIQIQTENISAS